MTHINGQCEKWVEPAAVATSLCAVRTTTTANCRKRCTPLTPPPPRPPHSTLPPSPHHPHPPHSTRPMPRCAQRAKTGSSWKTELQSAMRWLRDLDPFSCLLVSSTNQSPVFFSLLCSPRFSLWRCYRKWVLPTFCLLKRKEKSRINIKTTNI